MEIADVLGVPKADAIKYLESHGWKVRVLREDEKSHMVTKDFRTNRVNLQIDGGVVTEVDIG